MTGPFTHSALPVIHFGAGKTDQLPSLIKQFGNRTLILTGSGSVKKSDAWKKTEKLLSYGKLIISWETISGEPSPELIDRLTNSYTGPLPDVVVAVGGGSVIDAGKAVSAMLRQNDSVIHYLEGIGVKQYNGRKIPFIAVPTTSGTGSEATKNAVLSRVGPGGFKKSLRHERLVPDIAVVDPLFTVSCPAALTAATGMDAFTQLLESYVSTSATPLTDAIAFSGLEAVARSLKKTVEDGQSLEARADMAYASLVSGIALANAGLGLVHGFASAIGGLFPIPHGVVCGTLMAPCMEFTVRRLLVDHPEHPAIKKFADTGKLFAPPGRKDQRYYCESLIETLYRLSAQLEIPGLNSYGVTESDINPILAETGNKNNPVKLTPDDWRKILQTRL